MQTRVIALAALAWLAVGVVASTAAGDSLPNGTWDCAGGNGLRGPLVVGPATATLNNAPVGNFGFDTTNNRLVFVSEMGSKLGRTSQIFVGHLFSFPRDDSHTSFVLSGSFIAPESDGPGEYGWACMITIPPF